MGWNINVVSNTLQLSEEVFEELSAKAEENGHFIDRNEDGTIVFDEDAMEHMDFLWEKWSINVLDKPEVNGEVIFGSFDGDNAGEYWGYRFEDGKMKQLKFKANLEVVS